jgi:hypothetical protein
MEEMNLKYLGGNAVNLLYRLKGYLPGNDWSNLLLDGAILPNVDLSGKNFSHTSLKYANLDNVNFTGSDFSDSNLTEVRIEETTPVQSIAIAPGEKTLALYHDGAIREWTYDRVKGQVSNNLTGNIKAKGMKLIAQPGNDLAIFHDRRLYFYDRMGNELIQKADIEIKPGIKLIKATRKTLLLKDESDNQSRIVLVDLDKPAVVKTLTSSPYALCDHLDAKALILLNEREDIHIIDLSSANKPDLIISTVEKVSCIASCKCGGMEGQYLLGVGLYNGYVQIWKIRVQQWEFEKLLEHLVHKEKQPVKDITFMDECRVVSGGLDKIIKLLRFNHEGQVVGEIREFKMTLQCRGMKIDGVIREKVEQKKLLELLENAK